MFDVGRDREGGVDIAERSQQRHCKIDRQRSGMHRGLNGPDGLWFGFAVR